MKIRPGHIFSAAVSALVLAGMLILAGCGRSQRSKALCNALDVQIKDAWEFVTPEDIKGFLDKKYGVYIGVRLDSLDLARMERLLEQKSIVMNSEAWTTRDGVLHISIVQRAPALRFQKGEEGFYMDRTGYVFPLHSSYTADVPVIEGTLPALDSASLAAWSEGLLNLSDYIASSKQWKDKIEKIRVNDGGEVELKTVEGKERFIFGAPDKIKDKFEKMGRYCSVIRPAKEEGLYKSVNLKYNKQIICRKDI